MVNLKIFVIILNYMLGFFVDNRFKINIGIDKNKLKVIYFLIVYIYNS